MFPTLRTPSKREQSSNFQTMFMSILVYCTTTTYQKWKNPHDYMATIPTACPFHMRWWQHCDCKHQLLSWRECWRCLRESIRPPIPIQRNKVIPRVKGNAQTEWVQTVRFTTYILRGNALNCSMFYNYALLLSLSLSLGIALSMSSTKENLD